MSYNTKLENNYNIRVKDILVDNSIKKKIDGEWVEITPGGGGGGGDLPYYLKTNAVQIQNVGVSNTNLNSSSVDVNDVVGNKSSSLLSDKLILGDVNGNANLVKDDIINANKLTAAMVDPINTTSNLNQTILIYDSSLNKISKSNTVRLSDGFMNTKLEPTSIAVYNGGLNARIIPDNISTNSSSTFSSMKPNYLGIYDDTDRSSILMESGTIQCGISVNKTPKPMNTALSNSILSKDSLNFNSTGYLSLLNSNELRLINSSTLEFSQIGIGSFRAGVSTNASSIILNSAQPNAWLTKSSLSLYNGSITQSLTANDIAVTNKLKALTSKVADANSKMMIYNATNSSFNYTDIPTGLVMPTYLYSNYIRMDGSAESLKGYLIIDGGTSNNAKISVHDNSMGSGPQYTSLISSGIKFHPNGPTTSNDVVLNKDGAAVAMKLSGQNYLKKFTLASATDLVYITDNFTGASNTLKTYDLDPHDELLIDSRNGNYLCYNQWKALRVTSSDNNYIVKIDILQHDNRNDTSQNTGSTKGTEVFNIADVIWRNLPSTIGTATAGSLCFRMINSNSTIHTGDYFRGIIRIKMVCKDTTILTTNENLVAEPMEFILASDAGDYEMISDTEEMTEKIGLSELNNEHF